MEFLARKILINYWIDSLLVCLYLYVLKFLGLAIYYMVFGFVSYDFCNACIDKYIYNFFYPRIVFNLFYLYYMNTNIYILHIIATVLLTAYLGFMDCWHTYNIMKRNLISLFLFSLFF